MQKENSFVGRWAGGLPGTTLKLGSSSAPLLLGFPPDTSKSAAARVAGPRPPCPGGHTGVVWPRNPETGRLESLKPAHPLQAGGHLHFNGEGISGPDPGRCLGRSLPAQFSASGAGGGVWRPCCPGPWLSDGRSLPGRAGSAGLASESRAGVQAGLQAAPEVKSPWPPPRHTLGGVPSHPLLWSLDPSQPWPGTQARSSPPSSLPGTA